MNYSLIYKTEALTIAIILFIWNDLNGHAGKKGLVRWGTKRRPTKGGINSLLGVLFALSGFILAFTFGMSGTRLEKVRNVVEKLKLMILVRQYCGQTFMLTASGCFSC